MKTNQTRTIDHDEIRTWVEDRGGHPAIVGSSRGALEEGGGMLRISFGGDDENLEEVSWDEFFRLFDENDLAFVYEDTTADDELAYTYRFVARTTDGEMDMAEEMGSMDEPL
ncbi:hypothetical protein KW798_02830 [Candidatus Parcubacteria bacterium]|nr:hypothetical protein [Candidatus Parcubacteria bacterium]